MVRAVWGFRMCVGGVFHGIVRTRSNREGAGQMASLLRKQVRNELRNSKLGLRGRKAVGVQLIEVASAQSSEP